MEWDEYPGRIEAVDSVEVRARVGGYLQSIHFKDGAEVRKGDLLFVIDPRPYQSEVDRAQAEVNQAKTRLELAANDLARADKLLKFKAISEEEADTRHKKKREAEAALESANAALQASKLNLEYTQITAPISGRIGRKLLTEGNLINAGQGQSTLLTTIVSIDPVYCYFDADEKSVLKYRQLMREGKWKNENGQVACELQLSNETGFPHKGAIDFINNQIDSATGTLRVRGVFNNPGPDRILQPGFFARVRVPGSNQYRALLVPEKAIGTDQGQKFVYVVDAQETVQYRKVALGPIIDNLRVLRSGIQPDEWVIVDGLMAVRPGAKVKPERGTEHTAPGNSVATNQN